LTSGSTSASLTDNPDGGFASENVSGGSNPGFYDDIQSLDGSVRERLYLRAHEECPAALHKASPCP
jgi:hypothetical protein